MKSDEPTDAPLVLYDGECGFCHRSIRFILRHERTPALRFAPLQSEAGRMALIRHGLQPDFFGSLVLIEAGHAYTYSTAAIRTAAYLRFPWKLATLGGVLPRPVRDAAYRFVARHRIRLAGRVEACELPQPGQRERFTGVPSPGADPLPNPLP